jgi:hypothetical protein
MAPKHKDSADSPTRNRDAEKLDCEALIKECEDAVEELLDRQLGGDTNFETYEKALLEVVHEIARRRLEKKLQSVSDGLAPRLAIDHSDDWHGIREDTVATYRRHCPGTVTYHSLVGPLRVRRYTYRECARNGATYVPLDLAAGLMERMTPALAQCVAIGYAHMPLRTCEELMLAGGLRPPSRSTLDRTARDLGAYAVACNADIEPQVRANEVTHPQTRVVAIGLDRVAVPMRHGEDLEGRGAYSSALRNSRPHPKRRDALRGPVQWRMDYVGTVAFLDENKQLLESRKYRLPGDADISAIVERIMSDLRHTLMQRPIELAVIQDGAPELWSALSAALSREPSMPRWTEVLDWYHLDERLTRCLEVCVASNRHESQRARWHDELKGKRNGANHVIRSLKRKAADADVEALEQLSCHIGYIERNKHRMQYVDYEQRGIPIGSGVTEGACKSVVNARAKRSGQRWSQRGLTAALHLRAMHESNRFDGFWSFFARRYRAKNIVPLGFDVEAATAH